MHRVVVVGAGISGLATAWRIRERAERAGVPVDVRVLEAEDRPGGKIRSIRSADGFHVEGGPNGFLDSKPETLALCEALGLTDRLLRSSDAARKRFVYRHGALHQLPESPPAFLKSKLMSLPGRLRILAEPFVPAAPPDLDESLAEFGARRLGREAVDALLDPMVTGIFAGDPAQMSVGACFPRIKELERDHGSLIRAMIRLQREKARERKALAASGGPAEGPPHSGPSGPGGRLTTFAGGVTVLTDALAASLGDALECGVAVDSLERDAAGRYHVLVAGRDPIVADEVVLACPAPAAARIVQRVASAARAPLVDIPYVPANVVALGFARADVAHALDGFGFLIPRTEQRRILGTLWTSSIFPGERAPDGQVLLRTLVGGARNPEIAALDDGALLEAVRGELRDILGIAAAPTFERIVRWDAAIPQYTVGHRTRLKRIEDGLAPAPGVTLTGNAFRGVGINDCTREAERVADDLVARLVRGATRR